MEKIRTIGWIRKGDKAACGATVIEGIDWFNSHGQKIAVQGARMSCANGCVIAEGYPHSKVGTTPRVIHGMRTSCGCPLLSTLNNIDGVAKGSDEEVPIRYVMENGLWVGKTNEGFDQHFLLQDEVTGEPLAHRKYKITCNGKVFEGRTGIDGKTERIETNDPASAEIHVFAEGE